MSVSKLPQKAQLPKNSRRKRRLKIAPHLQKNLRKKAKLRRKLPLYSISTCPVVAMQRLFFARLLSRNLTGRL